MFRSFYCAFGFCRTSIIPKVRDPKVENAHILWANLLIPAIGWGYHKKRIETFKSPWLFRVFTIPIN